MTDQQSAAVQVRDVNKRFGSFTALQGINLSIHDNEFFTLLGPSGCGKTTLLRMIAGFEATSEGAIFLYGEEIERLPPHERPVNTVFQSYALFPHMTVAENIGFGLKMLDWSSTEQKSRVAEMIRMVRLQEFAERKPQQLSGGQQQRVALARAMAPRPKVLLLDEPLSALDLKLRQQMRAELKQIQRQTGITFVFVTHDQEEALSMSDRVAVMSAGAIQQIGTPTEIYEDPINRFVAGFIGETNLLEAVVRQVATQGGSQEIIVELDGIDETLRAITSEAVSPEQKGVVSFRPERLKLLEHANLPSSPASKGFVFSAVLRSSVYLGTDYQYVLELDNNSTIILRIQNLPESVPEVQPGERLNVALAPGDVRFLVD